MMRYTEYAKRNLTLCARGKTGFLGLDQCETSHYCDASDAPIARERVVS